ncbi:YceD family protein [Mucilaginibacter aquatilis]|uniref:DUF177 domain-containing protein n=1 Tax=Mucilaginibacter aquatilis TaxID=1517760 RepID=A0A6I4IC76_9SPHI|nr:DUF177 domain-containing protein [Mucilaginibacter aquatilis]MVN92517.1 DUF177 domain-containing protein [Mucilaginibacter aquatilis]
MKTLKTYSIPYTGLKLGRHEFDYVVDESFFKEFEYSLVKNGKLQCNVVLDKQETMIILDFHIFGTVELACDRCLSEYNQPVDIHEQQIAKFGEEEIDEDEEIITLGKNDTEIDIAGLIYEYITVAVPYITACSNEGNGRDCDKDMLDRLNELSGGDEKEKSEDPRWDALKKLK